ncbi:MAG: hypothetical protein JW795_06480, partial [Chitinivibrionales bacterium]|nr:hypothetical protein [Chitinivibrionales bacterium]
MTRSINIVLLSSLLCVLFSCGGKSKKADEGGSATSSSFPRDKTYYLVGVQWGDPSSFNPCDQNPSFPVWYPSNLMYEHLVEYNTLTGKLDPVIGKLHTQTASTISFAINAAARWSDNTPLTAADVKYTYEFGKQFPDFPFGYVWDYLEKITVDTVTEGSAKVERVNFHLDKKQNNPLAVLDVIIMQVIMPKHV